jgi:hypothetical protein
MLFGVWLSKISGKPEDQKWQPTKIQSAAAIEAFPENSGP